MTRYLRHNTAQYNTAQQNTENTADKSQHKTTQQNASVPYGPQSPGNLPNRSLPPSAQWLRILEVTEVAGKGKGRLDGCHRSLEVGDSGRAVKGAEANQQRRFLQQSLPLAWPKSWKTPVGRGSRAKTTPCLGTATSNSPQVLKPHADLTPVPNPLQLVQTCSSLIFRPKCCRLKLGYWSTRLQSNTIRIPAVDWGTGFVQHQEEWVGVGKWLEKRTYRHGGCFSAPPDRTAP